MTRDRRPRPALHRTPANNIHLLSLHSKLPLRDQRRLNPGALLRLALPAPVQMGHRQAPVGPRGPRRRHEGLEVHAL